MLKNLCKRWGSMLLIALMLAPMLPQELLQVQAAANNVMEFSGITAEGEFVEKADNSGFSCSATAIKGSCGDSYSAEKKTVTLKNTAGISGQVQFSYTITANGGSVTINGTSCTGNGTFELPDVPAGGTVTIVVDSGKNQGNRASATLSNIRLVITTEIATTFLPSDHGSYTVDGKTIAEETTITRSGLESYMLKAKADEGYKFVGWYSDNKAAERTANWNFNPLRPQVIAPLFLSEDTPVFQVGEGNEFYDLHEAITFAQSSAQKTIVLIEDGTLPAGDYSIPNGVTLLIPYNAAHTLCTTEPMRNDKDKSDSSNKAYKTLTMGAGAHITVQSGGAVSVSARAQMYTPNTGVVLGPWGLISMESGSSITLVKNANLYCWGFITGQGSVLAKSGSHVYEDFQVTTFRGGSASAGMNGGKTNKVFPFTQYYVQNIEVPMTMEAGATETVCIGAYMSVGLQKGGGVLIGENDGLFRLKNGTLTKRYDGSADRLVIEVNGEAEISQMKVKVGMAGDIDSTKFVVPITNNMTVHVHEGHSVAMRYDMAILPGAQMIVDKGAELTAEANVYVYDRDEWMDKDFADYQMNKDPSKEKYKNFVPLVNVPGRIHTRTDDDLADALLDINGTMTVNGALYTTAGGADVTSSAGSGQILFSRSAGTEKNTYQVTQGGNGVTAVAVPITPVRLHNAGISPEVPGQEYSQTAAAAANDVFAVKDGMWHKNLDDTERPHYPHTTDDTTRENEVAATCAAEGSYDEVSVCAVCGEVLRETQKIPALGHDYAFAGWGEWTETADGYAIAANLVCQREGCAEDCDGHAKAETERVKITTETGSATCTQAGTVTYAAAITIGDIKHETEPYTVTVGEPLGHSYDEGEITTEPTCVADGVKTYTCTRCGDSYTEVVAAAGHTYGAPEWKWMGNTDGSWTAQVVFHCVNKNCDDAQMPEVTVSAQETKKATCTDKGEVTYTASIIFGEQEYTDTKAVAISAIGHTEQIDAAVAAACTTTGLTEGVHCTVCGEILTARTEIPALGHDYAFAGWGEWTETADGYAIAANLVCQREGCAEDCEGHAKAETERVKITTETGSATCTQTGMVTYAAAITIGDIKHETEPYTVTVGEPLGHSYDEGEITTEPTCVAEGVKTYTCTRCGDKRTEVVEALGHGVEHHEAKAATCTEIGWSAYDTCSRCDYTTYSEIAALGHDVEQHEAKAATCTEAGWSAYDTCSRCDYTTYSEIAAIGHTLTATEAKAATCTEDGNIAYWTCEACGKIYSDEAATKEIALTDTVVKALEHKGKAQVQENVVEATCTATGSYDAVVYCERCNEELSREALMVDKLPHTLVHRKAKAATCTEIGWDAYDTCANCDYTTYKEIQALEHDYVFGSWGAWTETDDGYTIAVNLVCRREGCAEDCDGHTKVVTDDVEIVTEEGTATCTQADTVTYTAAITIGVEEHKAEPKTVTVGEALGHSYDEGAVTTEPTCVAEGVKTYTCTRCGDKHTEVVEALGHDVEQHEAKAATCTEAGWNAYDTCTRCDYTTYSEIAALGHDVEHHEAKAATCTEIGWSAYDTCTRCDYTTYSEIAATGHTLTATEAKAATCTEDGNIAYWTCETCGKIYSDETATVEITLADTVVATLGHALEHHEAKAATCTEIGWKAYDTCLRCDYTTYSEIAAAGHTLTATEAKSATCTEDGSIAYWTCEACNKIYSDADGKNPIAQKDTILEKLGHKTKVPVRENETAPTCTAEGHYDLVVYCERCNEELSREALMVDKLPHTLVHREAKAATCTDIGWDDYDFCENCDYSTYSEIAALEHRYDSGKITTPATCTENGEKTYTCVRGDDFYTETISATGHVYGAPEWKWSEEADGNWIAQVTFCCENENCDDTQTPEVTVTENTHDATCTGEGLTIYTASADFEGESYQVVKDDIILSPTGHAYGAPVWDWTDEGVSVTFVCASCSDLQIVEAETEEEMQEATCTKNGAVTYTARAMFDEQEYMDTQIVALPAVGHTEEIDLAVAATCTAPGLTEGSHCAVCGETLTRQTEIPALGHDWGVGEITLQPTCTHEGEKTYTCAHDAGHVWMEAMEKAAHTLAHIEAIAATCLTEGQIEYWKCTACEMLFDRAENGREIRPADTVVPAVGHNYGEPEFSWQQNDQGGWITEAKFICSFCQEVSAVNTAVTVADTKTPDCTQAGTRIFTAVASLTPESEHYTEIKEIELPALGHDYQEEWRWDEDFASAALVLTCKRDEKHIESVEAVISTQTAPATTKAAGKTVYTANVVFADKNYTDMREREIPRLVKTSSKGGGGGSGSRTSGIGVSASPVVQPPVAPAEVEISEGDVPLAGAPFHFKDVTVDDWFYQPVEYVYHEGIMKGTSETEFTPAGDTTRGAITTMLYRMGSSPAAVAAAEFYDVQADAWYAEAVNWAADSDVVKGYGDGTFGPGDVITREQLAAMIYRYAKLNNRDTGVRADLSGFADAESVSDWAYEPVAWAVGAELLQGSDGKLNPTGTATRAEAATILMRLHRMMAA